MSNISGEQITGREYLEQRFANALSTQVFDLVVDRNYGSNFEGLLDSNIDDEFRMRAFSRVAAAIRNPINGLDDIALTEIELQQTAANSSLKSPKAKWLGNPISVGAQQC